VASTQLFPQIIDASTLGAKLTSPIFLPIGIEGAADPASPAIVNKIYTISTPNDANTTFGSTSRLAQLIKFMLTRGAAPIYGIASAKTDPPSLAERKAAWDELSSDSRIRIRLTGSLLQSDFAALATNLTEADAIYNKQFAIVGMATGTTKSALIAAATALNSKKLVLVGPAVYDETSPAVLRDGGFLAAAIAARLAQNGDPTNDLDREEMPLLTGIEKTATGFPLFRVKTVGGVATNDFEDVLQGGGSPVMEDANGVSITHLRTTYITDGTFDALMTRIIVDQVFIDVRDYLLNSNFLQSPNSAEVRGRIKSGVEALLLERRSWINMKEQNDGSLGYNVQVTSSPDNRQVTVAYEGTVVRGISTIQVAATLDIPV
jgi:hypothetical protein